MSGKEAERLRLLRNHSERLASLVDIFRKGSVRKMMIHHGLYQPLNTVQFLGSIIAG